MPQLAATLTDRATSPCTALSRVGPLDMSVFSRLWGDDPLLESSTHGHSLFKSCGAAGDTARQAAAEAHDELMELRANPRFFSPRELLRYDGSDPSHPLLLAIKGIVLDVSTGVDFYGPGERYNVFAGCDASRAFALSMNASIDWENLHADMCVFAVFMP